MKKITLVIMGILLSFLVVGCSTNTAIEKNISIEDKINSNDTDLIKNNWNDSVDSEKSYLERRLETADQKQISKRPDYLPEKMYSKIPEMPEDFYQLITLIKLGTYTDFSNLKPEYYLQPEFFPNFEERGIPLLKNPPEGRWGAFGLATYPADSVATITAGDSLDLYFFIKSDYIVETYQGINLEVKCDNLVEVPGAFTMPDGTKNIKQNCDDLNKYFDVKFDPNLFVLEPNFPIFSSNGTKKVKVTISAKKDVPVGNYVIGVDTGLVPAEVEQSWISKYLNLYASGSMTKIDRPRYRAFIKVVRS